MANFGRYTIGRTDVKPMNELDGYNEFDHMFKMSDSAASRVISGNYSMLQDEWSELEPYIKHLSKQNPDVEFIEYLSVEGIPDNYVLWKDGDRVQTHDIAEQERVNMVLDELQKQRENPSEYTSEPKYSRQIIDDYFFPDGPLPRCGLEDTATSENARQNWHEANTRFAACASMYKWLNEQGILKKEAFCYDVIPGKKDDANSRGDQISFAIDSKDLLKYKDQMLASGVPNADIAVQYMLSEKGKEVQPSTLSGATCLTWTMQTYRDSGGCVGRSWETPHEQCYYIKPFTGIGDIVHNRYEAYDKLKDGSISEDEYFDTVKQGIKDMYKLDRASFLSKVPHSFVKDIDNSESKLVFMPCGKNMSDSGRMSFFVDKDDVQEDDYGKYTIRLGDFEKFTKVSVMKDGDIPREDGKHTYKNLYLKNDEISKHWSADRKEYSENFKREYGVPVDVKGVDVSSITQVKSNISVDNQARVNLCGIGTIYVDNDSVKINGNTADIHFNSGLDSVRVLAKDDAGNYVRKNMNAMNLVSMWEAKSDERAKAAVDKVVDKGDAVPQKDDVSTQVTK